MAEIAVGTGAVLAAEQVISTTVEAGVAGYLVTKPTMPLKATFTMIANAKDDSTQRSLARSNHTLTVIANKAYIFGGETAHDGIATNDLHVVTLVPSGKPEPDYHLIPAIPGVDDGKVPRARTKHAACAHEGRIVIYGGCDENDEVIDESSSIWLFDLEKTAWTLLNPVNSDSAPGLRRSSAIFAHDHSLILSGGESPSGAALSDVWKFDVDAETWTQLPSAPVPTSNAALTGGHLYLISGPNTVSSNLHILDLSSQDADSHWDTFSFPTNPLAPGPRARHNGGLLPISTGYGRSYLAYFLGSREAPTTVEEPSEDHSRGATQWSDTWTLQLPSKAAGTNDKLSTLKNLNPARIKDAIRSAVGADSGEYGWAEVEVKLPSDLPLPEGKLHPGPRAEFGCDVTEDGKTIVLWGGKDAKGERVGDGWFISLE